MKIIIFLLSAFICIKTFSYGIYEYKNYQNKLAGITIMCLAIVSLIIPNIVVFILYRI